MRENGNGMMSPPRRPASKVKYTAPVRNNTPAGMATKGRLHAVPAATQGLFLTIDAYTHTLTHSLTHVRERKYS